MSGVVVGVDLGGTKISAAAVHDDGTLGPRVRRPTPARDGSRAVADALVLAAHEAAARAGAGLAAVGVGAAGVIDADGVVTHATDHIAGWAGTPLARWLSLSLGVPVRVVNDVQAAAVGEATHGAAAGASSALVVAVGTGIGGALVRDGAVVPGTHGFAGSVGHLPAPGNPGTGSPRRCACGAMEHVETYASGPGMERTYRERTGRDVALHDLVAELGADAEAARVLDAGARLLGRTLGAVLSVVDPAVVVVGGGVAEIGEAYLRPLAQACRAAAHPATAATPVRAAALGQAAAVVGAAHLARGALPAATRRRAAPPPG